MTKSIDNRLNRLNSASLLYLKKAQMVLKSKNPQEIVKETGIPSDDVRAMARLERLDMAEEGSSASFVRRSWLDVMLLAEYYDRILPRIDEKSKPDLKTSSIVIDGRLFADPNYQDMTLTAKLIYGYLTLPSQNRYKDEKGREFVICDLDDLKRLTGHTKPTVKKALLELQDHELLTNYENKTLPQPQRYYVLPIKETEEWWA